MEVESFVVLCVCVCVVSCVVVGDYATPEGLLTFWRMLA